MMVAVGVGSFVGVSVGVGIGVILLPVVISGVCVVGVIVIVGVAGAIVLFPSSTDGPLVAVGVCVIAGEVVTCG